MQKVRGREHLYKDPRTGVLINTDSDGFEAARFAKQRILDSNQKQIELEQRIEKLESILNELALEYQ